MSRRDSTSLNIRGIPRELVDALDRAAEQSGCTRNALMLAAIADYASGEVASRSSPPPFDPARARNAAHPVGTTSIAINGIVPDIWRVFLARARDEGWYSKNALIVELLRDIANDVRG